MKALKERVSHLEADLMFLQTNFKNLEEQMRQVLSMQQQQNGFQSTSQNKLGDGYQPGQGKDIGNGSAYQNMNITGACDTGSWPQDRGDQYAGSATESFPGGSIETKKAATLAPHPNVKKIDPSVLPPPPPDASQLRAASLLRGFSSEFTSFEAHLFENLVADPPESSNDVVMNEKHNIKRMESLQISKLGRVPTSSEMLPPADTDITGL